MDTTVTAPVDHAHLHCGVCPHTPPREKWVPGNDSHMSADVRYPADYDDGPTILWLTPESRIR